MPIDVVRVDMFVMMIVMRIAFGCKGFFVQPFRDVGGLRRRIEVGCVEQSFQAEAFVVGIQDRRGRVETRDSPA